MITLLTYLEAIFFKSRHKKIGSPFLKHISFEHSNYYEPKNSNGWLITKYVMKLPIPIPNYPNYPHGEGLTPLSHVNCRFGIRGWGRVLGTHMHINCNPAITISQDLHYFFRKLLCLENVFFFPSFCLSILLSFGFSSSLSKFIWGCPGII